MGRSFSNLESWETNELITKVKMNAMCDNSVYLKEVGPDFQTLFCGDLIVHDYPKTVGDDTSVYISTTPDYAAGTLIGTYTPGTYDAWTEYVEADIDVSNKTGEVFITFLLGGDVPAQIRYFNDRPSTGDYYLTMWFTPQYGEAEGLFPVYPGGWWGCNAVTIIGHTTAQGWT